MAFFTLLYGIRVTLSKARHPKILSDLLDLLPALSRLSTTNLAGGEEERAFAREKAAKYCLEFIGFF